MTSPFKPVSRLIFALAIGAAPFAASAYDNQGPSPDMVAWEVFAEAVAPSGTPRDRQLEFETWASDDDLYAASPPRWPASESHVRRECKQSFDREAAKAAG